METAIESEASNRATAISDLVDGAPALLDTLNELAAAINDDENFVTTITNLIDANETHIDNVATLTGVAKDSANLGTFTGGTITDSSTVKAALQLLETAVETKAATSVVTEIDGNVDNLIDLSGVAENATDWELSLAPPSPMLPRLRMHCKTWRPQLKALKLALLLLTAPRPSLAMRTRAITLPSLLTTTAPQPLRLFLRTLELLTIPPATYLP